jgi:hypothetical protein
MSETTKILTMTLIRWLFILIAYLIGVDAGKAKYDNELNHALGVAKLRLEECQNGKGK